MIWVFLALVTVVTAPFVAERLKRTVNAARGDAPGQIAELPNGATHFQWHGPDDGPVLVCIHGLTTPSYVWTWLMPGLTGMGFRVLSYDLYGRGYSDRPKGAHSAAFYVRQLDELLHDQNVSGKVTLLGYSMGGSIATVFANAEPDRAAKAVLLAPAGMLHNAGTLAIWARNTPLLGDWLHLGFAGRQLVEGAKSQDGPPAIAAELARRQQLENSRRGYLPAVLSSLRHLLGAPLEKDHRALAGRGQPVAAIWGADDTVIPIAARDQLAQWNPAARQFTIPGAGHGLVYTRPAEVLAALEMVLKD